MMELLNNELVFAHVKQQIRYRFITFQDSLPCWIHMVGFVGYEKSDL